MRETNAAIDTQGMKTQNVKITKALKVLLLCSGREWNDKNTRIPITLHKAKMLKALLKFSIFSL